MALQHVQGAQLLAQCDGISYDAHGRRTGWRATVPADAQLSGETRYAYDAQGHLVEEFSQRGPGYHAQVRVDAQGNPLAMHRQTLQYDAGNRLHGAGFAYDAQGAPTRYAGTRCTVRHGRLVHFGDGFAAGYGADGRRSWSEQDGVRVTALYLVGPLGPVVREVLTGEGPQQFMGMPHPQAGAAQYTPTYYLLDTQGDVLFRLTNDHRVHRGVLYDAWGVCLRDDRSQDPYGYKAQWGYYTDHATGLLLCTHRYYDPLRGRFVTKDPLGRAGGTNLYAYCQGDPVNAVDPSGCEEIDLGKYGKWQFYPGDQDFEKGWPHGEGIGDRRGQWIDKNGFVYKGKNEIGRIDAAALKDLRKEVEILIKAGIKSNIPFRPMRPSYGKPGPNDPPRVGRPSPYYTPKTDTTEPPIEIMGSKVPKNIRGGGGIGCVVPPIQSLPKPPGYRSEGKDTSSPWLDKTVKSLQDAWNFLNMRGIGPVSRM